jgi:UDP-glucuronate 4-epimerase
LRQAVGFTPNTPIADGIRKFIDWYRAFHGA